MPRRSSSSGNFSRKLQPAKRALKRLASKLQSKLSELDFPRAIRVIGNGTARIITRLFRKNNNHRSLQVAKTASYRSHSHHTYISDYYNSTSNRNLLRKSFSAIFIDQLYPDDDEDHAAASASAPHEHHSSFKSSNTAPMTIRAEVVKTTANRAETTSSVRGKEVVKTTTNRAETTTSLRGKEVVKSTANRAETTSVRGKEVVVSNNTTTNYNSFGVVYNNSKRPPVPRNSCREGAAVRTASSLVQRRKKEALVIMEEMDDNKNNDDENNPMETLEDAWREVVARSPQLRPVDVRAGEFINNFRSDMKIQKAQSILEYQNLLGTRS